MHLSLDYTPRCPQKEQPFTESSFVRKSISVPFEPTEIGVALVDLWNLGWPEGPISNTLGEALSLERGRSHADRKQRIIEQKIAPTVNTLRAKGIRIFHCNHAEILARYKQGASARNNLKTDSIRTEPDTEPQDCSGDETTHQWPPREWVADWQREHREQIWAHESWGKLQGKEVYPQIRIPEPVQPQKDDILVSTHQEFHERLAERKIRILLYMGFETDECVVNSDYGIVNMKQYGYLCIIVRDCTTTYELAETAEGLWKTRVAIANIEANHGYSTTSERLI
ncbi:MAG: isochorismatase family protein [Chloroflexota bacterium]